MTIETPTLLWTVEDYLERSRDPNPGVRAWAMARLQDQHPLQALDRAAEVLGDADHRVRSCAFEVLQRCGDATLAPRVLAGLEAANGRELAQRARLLGDWGSTDAIEPLLAHLEAHALELHELSGICQALSLLAPERLSRRVKQQLDGGAVDALSKTSVIDGLANCHLHTDIAWMVDRWLDEPRHGQLDYPLLQVLRHALGPAWLARALPETFREGAHAVAERVEREEQVRLPLGEPELDRLFLAVLDGQVGWPRTLLAAAQALVEERRIPVEAWRASAERPEGYRWQVLATLGLLEHLVTIEYELPTLDAMQRRELLALSLAGLAGMVTDQDDPTWLDARGEGRREALLELLASTRERVHPQVERELSELGPTVLPSLREQLVQHDRYWAAARAARVIERIAAHHPRRIIPMVEDLLDAIERDKGDHVHEAAYRTLRLLGPEAAPAVERKLRHPVNEYGDLSDVLACYPIPRSAELLHELLLDDPEGPRDIRGAIVTLASADSLEFLIEQGFGELEDEGWVQALLDLSAIHGLSHPHEERWRKLVEQAKVGRKSHEERWAELLRAKAQTARKIHEISEPAPTPKKPRHSDEACKKRKARRQQRKKARTKNKKRKKKR